MTVTPTLLRHGRNCLLLSMTSRQTPDAHDAYSMVAACAFGSTLTLLCFREGANTPAAERNNRTLHATVELTPQFLSGRPESKRHRSPVELIHDRAPASSIPGFAERYSLGVSVREMVLLEQPDEHTRSCGNKDDPVVALLIFEHPGRTEADGGKRQDCAAATAHIHAFQWRLNGDGTIHPPIW